MHTHCLSPKISKFVTDTRSNQLSNINHKDVKKLRSSDPVYFFLSTKGISLNHNPL